MYSIEAKDQVGLELQHISDGIVYTDGINGSLEVGVLLKMQEHVPCHLCLSKSTRTNNMALCMQVFGV